MTRRPGPYDPRPYELRVEGHLDEHWSAWLGGLSLTHELDGTSTLRGVLADQAELHGLLTKVRDLGATLISLTPVDTDSPDSAEQQRSAPSDGPASGLKHAPQQHPSTSRPSGGPTEPE